MALVFSDEFNGTLGSDPPAGWTKNNLTANATVSTGGYRGQCVVFGNGGSIYQLMTSTYADLTAFVISSANGGFFAPLAIAQSTTTVVGTTTTTGFVQIATVNYGNDQELYVADFAGNMTCFGNAHHHYLGRENVWTFMQLDVGLSGTTIGTASAIKVTATVRLNGEVVATGISSFVSNLTPYVDTIFLNGASNVNAAVDEVYLYSPALSGLIVTPNEAAGRKARVSQAIIEHLDLPSAGAGRVSQALIEHLQLPSAGNVRISQAVIELIMAGGGGWRVYEA